MRTEHDNEPVDNLAITPSGQITAPAARWPDPALLRKKDEHTARGIAYQERGEYVKAIDEFAAACRVASDLTDDYEWQECDDNLERLLFVLHYYFNPNVDPESFRFWQGEPLSDATLRALAAKTYFPPSYLVVGGNYVFASYPLTEEGRTAAIEHARRLAHEGGPDRHEWPGMILGDVPDFPMNVYEHKTQPSRICWFDCC